MFRFLCGHRSPSGCLAFVIAVSTGLLPIEGSEKPNIVIVLCDDLGFGDVQCLNPQHGKIATPRIDRFAAEGMTFLDAHSASSVCTPTRYGLLTGRYCWRTNLQRGVVTGYAPSIIDERRVTLAAFLSSQGYHTGVVGKWHLNCRYLDPATGRDLQARHTELPPVGARIPDGPIHRGFDYFHGFHHARHMRAVIENDRVLEHEDEIQMLPRLVRRSVAYIETHAQEERPFFLYVPLGSPHTPIVPTPEWQGKSGLGSYGDFVMQTDDAFGQILDALQRCGVARKTLVIFSSDNGCSRAAKIGKLRERGHHVSAHFRGSKADIWDGGHRIPLLVRWPGHVAAHSRQGGLVCLNDVYATLAEVLGQAPPQSSCEDSLSFLPLLLGQPQAAQRTSLIHHSVSGHFAYRDGDWKLILARGSGGWSSPTEKQAIDAPQAQLYHMRDDPSEQSNRFDRDVEVADRLLKQLQVAVEQGRTTVGPPSPNNTAEIILWKSETGSPRP